MIITSLIARSVGNTSYANKHLNLFMILILFEEKFSGLEGGSWIDMRETCNECEYPTVPESYFFSAAKSSLWQHIRQCDQPEGRRSAQEGGESK